VTWPEPELDDGPEPELRPEPDEPEPDEPEPDELELDLCDELDLCELELDEPELVRPEPDELVPLVLECCAVLCEADEAWALAAPGRT